MTWHASLSIDYQFESDRTVARFAHEGPLRVLKSLYPQGDAVCHNVLIHPPGGLVGGDTLDIQVKVANSAHGLITTPGATRFYRSLGEPAVQSTLLQLQSGSRLEWLPLETILYNGCLAENRFRFELAPAAELLAWDVTALGLAHAHQAFDNGCLRQHMEFPGTWLEHASVDAKDTRLLNSALGLAGQRCMATLLFAAGSALDRARRDLALDAARSVLQAHELKNLAGVSSPNPQMLVLRVLAPQGELAMDLLKQAWACWRQTLWGMSATPPRIWAM